MTWARGTVVLLLGCAAAPAPVTHAQTAADSQRDGAGLYRTACAACHGPDGRGAPRATVGFDLALPDFTDCSFATPEADADWLAVVHDGGPARAFDRLMPAFGSALTAGANGTVTVCHSQTANLPAITRLADVLVAAIGRACFVKGDMVKPGVVVIDVGINRVPDATRKTGYRLVGDVKFDEVAPLASKITPVPGGVGPMTVAMLMKNTVKARRLATG
jgi:hypothetical protein